MQMEQDISWTSLNQLGFQPVEDLSLIQAVYHDVFGLGETNTKFPGTQVVGITRDQLGLFQGYQPRGLLPPYKPTEILAWIALKPLALPVVNVPKSVETPPIASIPKPIKRCVRKPKVETYIAPTVETSPSPTPVVIQTTTHLAIDFGDPSTTWFECSPLPIWTE